MLQPASGGRRPDRGSQSARDQARLDAAKALTFKDAAALRRCAPGRLAQSEAYLAMGATLATYANPIIGATPRLMMQKIAARTPYYLVDMASAGSEYISRAMLAFD